MRKTRKIALLGFLVSQGLVLHYIESFIPVLAPGAKLGLANIVTLITLIVFGFKEAFVVIILRSLLGPLLGGSVTGIIYSLTGGLLSGLIMGLLKYRLDKYFSLIGISTFGAIFHNIGQLLIASIIYGSFGILFTYMPILMFAAVLTGGFNGLVSYFVLSYIEKNNLLGNRSR